MVSFTATLLKFGEQGEKTGWTYIQIPENIALQLKPGNKKSFRVKGKLDAVAVKQIALIPMGNGHFVLAVNATLRKALKKKKGETVKVQLQEDKEKFSPPQELIDCLQNEPEAFKFFNHFPQSHQRYFCKWIESAKMQQTKAKRIAQVVNAMVRKMNFAEMLRAEKASRTPSGQ